MSWDWTANLCTATRNASVSVARAEEVLKAKMSTPVRNIHFEPRWGACLIEMGNGLLRRSGL